MAGYVLLLAATVQTASVPLLTSPYPYPRRSPSPNHPDPIHPTPNPAPNPKQASVPLFHSEEHMEMRAVANPLGAKFAWVWLARTLNQR